MLKECRFCQHKGSDIIFELIETWKSFFEQCTEYVFLESAVNDPGGVFFPRITFNCVKTEYLQKSLTTFQIWTKERNPTQLNKIARKLEGLVPASGSLKLPVYGNIIYEFFNMLTNQWEEFLLENTMDIFNWHVSQGFPPQLFEWRKSGGNVTGNLLISRGSSFIQNRMSDDIDILIYYGSIETKSHLLN